jgi:hypothetical protein
VLPLFVDIAGGCRFFRGRSSVPRFSQESTGAPPASTFTSQNALEIRLADLDADGDVDALLVASNNVYLMDNQAGPGRTPSFAVRRTYPVTATDSRAALFDADNGAWQPAVSVAVVVVTTSRVLCYRAVLCPFVSRWRLGHLHRRRDAAAVSEPARFLDLQVVFHDRPAARDGRADS